MWDSREYFCPGPVFSIEYNFLLPPCEPAPDNAKLVQLQQQPQNSKKLEDVAIDISDVIYSAKIWEKAGIASLVNGYSYTEIRPKLLFKGQNNFTSFSDYIKDIALDEFFYEEVATEFDIFKFGAKLIHSVRLANGPSPFIPVDNQWSTNL